MKYIKGTELLLNGTWPLDVVADSGDRVKVMAEYLAGDGMSSKIFSLPVSLLAAGRVNADGRLEVSADEEAISPSFAGMLHKLATLAEVGGPASWDNIRLEVTPSGILNRSLLSVEQQISLNNLEVRPLASVTRDDVVLVALKLGVPVEALSMHLSIVAGETELTQEVYAPGPAKHAPYYGAGRRDKLLIGNIITAKTAARVKKQNEALNAISTVTAEVT